MHVRIDSGQRWSGRCFISRRNALKSTDAPGTVLQFTSSPGCMHIATPTWRVQCSRKRKKQWPRFRSRSRQYRPASTRSASTSCAAACDACVESESSSP